MLAARDVRRVDIPLVVSSVQSSIEVNAGAFCDVKGVREHVGKARESAFVSGPFGWFQRHDQLRVIAMFPGRSHFERGGGIGGDQSGSKEDAAFTHYVRDLGRFICFSGLPFAHALFRGQDSAFNVERFWIESPPVSCHLIVFPHHEGLRSILNRGRFECFHLGDELGAQRHDEVPHRRIHFLLNFGIQMLPRLGLED